MTKIIKDGDKTQRPAVSGNERKLVFGSESYEWRSAKRLPTSTELGPRHDFD